MSQRAYRMDIPNHRDSFNVDHEWEIIRPYILNIDPEWDSQTFNPNDGEETLKLDVAKLREDVPKKIAELARLAAILQDCEPGKDVVLFKVG